MLQRSVSFTGTVRHEAFQPRRHIQCTGRQPSIIDTHCIFTNIWKALNEPMPAFPAVNMTDLQKIFRPILNSNVSHAFLLST